MIAAVARMAVAVLAAVVGFVPILLVVVVVNRLIVAAWYAELVVAGIAAAVVGLACLIVMESRAA